MGVKIYINTEEDIELQLKVFKRKVSYEGILESYKNRLHEKPKVRKQNKNRRKHMFIKYLNRTIFK